MLFQIFFQDTQGSFVDLPPNQPPNQPRPCIIFCSIQIFHNSGSESFIEFVNGCWQRINHFPTGYYGKQFDCSLYLFSVCDFNLTVLLHRELYTGFLQRINQFSCSVKFANGYYDNQLTDSNRWWYFYICQKFMYDRWITYLWLFVDWKATIMSYFIGYRKHKTDKSTARCKLPLFFTAGHETGSKTRTLIDKSKN